MFFEVLSPIYHSPITIDSLTYRVLVGTLVYSASAPMVGAWAGSVRPTTACSGLPNRAQYESLTSIQHRKTDHTLLL